MLAAIARGWWIAIAGIKNRLVPDRPGYHLVRAGPARGAVIFTNLRFGSRMLFGLYEGELSRWLKRFVRRGDVCYDIGAADGYYALAFSRLARPGRIYCFEPDAAHARQLESTIARNTHLGSTVAVHQLRLGRNGDDTAAALDDLVYRQGWPAPQVIKMDVDGGEVDILNGAERVLRDNRPDLIIEVHSIALESECARLLREAGYDPTVVENRRLMAENAFRQGHNRWICAEGRGPARAS
jgi:hypothetical protein